MKVKLSRFNNWIEQKKFTNFLFSVLLGLAVVAGVYIFFQPELKVAASFFGITPYHIESLDIVHEANQDALQNLNINTLDDETPPPVPTDTTTKSTYVAPTPTSDPDPIVNCHFNTNCGGGSMIMRSSACTQSTCCKVGNSWFTYANNSICTQAQYEYSRSRTVTVPTFAPLRVNEPAPTEAPYQSSQQYNDALNKFNQVVATPYQPQQFVAPTQKCYATWDEYFNAHPNYASQNISGMSGAPPCD